MRENLTITDIKADDTGVLETFLYHAVFVPPGEAPPPFDIIKTPDLRVYTDGWGKSGDAGVRAEAGGTTVGAAWARVIEGYGHVDGETPELAISCLPEWRGRGIGTALLAELFARLKEQGRAQTSLAVWKANRAVNFYRRAGYVIIGENDRESVMLKTLRD